MARKEMKKWPEAKRSLEERNQLVVENQRLVSYVYNMFRRNNSGIKRLGYDDGVAAGMLGLIRAAHDYDENKGKFSNYATPWIRSFIQLEVLRNNIIRIPEKCGIRKSLEVVMECERMAHSAKRIVYLSQIYSRTSDSEDMYEIEDEKSNGIGYCDLKGDITKAMRAVNKTDREVIHLLYWEGKTLKEVAAIMGISREGVRQKSERGINVMRKVLTGEESS